MLISFLADCLRELPLQTGKVSWPTFQMLFNLLHNLIVSFPVELFSWIIFVDRIVDQPSFSPFSRYYWVNIFQWCVDCTDRNGFSTEYSKKTNAKLRIIQIFSAAPSWFYPLNYLQTTNEMLWGKQPLVVKAAILILYSLEQYLPIFFEWSVVMAHILLIDKP